MLIYEREAFLRGATNGSFHGSQNQREMEMAWITMQTKWQETTAIHLSLTRLSSAVLDSSI